MITIMIPFIPVQKMRAYIFMINVDIITIPTRTRMAQSTRATIDLMQVGKGSIENMFSMQRRNRRKQQQIGGDSAQSSATKFKEEQGM